MAKVTPLSHKYRSSVIPSFNGIEQVFTGPPSGARHTQHSLHYTPAGTWDQLPKCPSLETIFPPSSSHRLGKWKGCCLVTGTRTLDWEVVKWASGTWFLTSAPGSPFYTSLLLLRPGVYFLRIWEQQWLHGPGVWGVETRREGAGRQSGEEGQLEEPELVKALLSPGRRGLSAARSGNIPWGLGKLKKLQVWSGGPVSPDGSPRVSPRDALGMLDLEFLLLSLFILGTCG